MKVMGYLDTAKRIGARRVILDVDRGRNGKGQWHSNE